VTEPPVLPDTTSDEREIGWGDDLDEIDDDDRLTDDRPPHYDDYEK
jgi:hypothetical protein